MTRLRPNILVTGTPGTGKTTTSEQVSRELGFRHVNLGELVKLKELHSGWDSEFECYVLDEDKVCDELEDIMEPGGIIVDYHGCDFFPERWFDLVIVLQTDNTVLYERLEKRGYSSKKVQNNVECEIMMMILEEATESYKEEIVVPLSSNTVEELEHNVARICAWAQQFQAAAAAR